MHAERCIHRYYLHVSKRIRNSWLAATAAVAVAVAAAAVSAAAVAVAAAATVGAAAATAHQRGVNRGRERKDIRV